MKDDVKKWIKEDGQKFLREIGIKKGQAILDFGCGEGHYTIPVSKVVAGDGKVYALDKDRKALNRLERIVKENNIKNIELIEEDSKIHLEDDSLDAVLCYDVIHYKNEEERRAIYEEVYRVLKKKGLFSVYPKHYRDDYPLDNLTNLSLEDIVKEIEESGFSLKDEFSRVLLHDENYNKGYVLNFRRW